MRQVIAITLLLASTGAWPTNAIAGGKKGKLNSSIEITRNDSIQIPFTQSTEVEGLTATLVLDHEAAVLVQGVLLIYASRAIAVSVVVDDQAESQPMVYATSYSVNSINIPILHTIVLAPGTHTITIRLTGYSFVDETTPPFEGSYQSRRLVVLAF